MSIILELMAMVALSIYIYNNSSDLIKLAKNKTYIFLHRNDSPDPPFNYKDLAEEYRVPSEGSAKEIEKFDNFDLYRDEVFDEDNLNPPTGIFTHSSEIEDLGLDTPDIYDREVAK